MNSQDFVKYALQITAMHEINPNAVIFDYPRKKVKWPFYKTPSSPKSSIVYTKRAFSISPNDIVK
jgi:hypothetical protein